MLRIAGDCSGPAGSRKPCRLQFDISLSKENLHSRLAVPSICISFLLWLQGIRPFDQCRSLLPLRSSMPSCGVRAHSYGPLHAPSPSYLATRGAFSGELDLRHSCAGCFTMFTTLSLATHLTCTSLGAFDGCDVPCSGAQQLHLESLHSQPSSTGSDPLHSVRVGSTL